MKKSPPAVATRQAGLTLDWPPICLRHEEAGHFLRATKRKAL